MSNHDLVKEHLEIALEEFAEESAREAAEKIRENTEENLEENVQGEEGLIEFMSDVEQSRDSGGRFMSGFEFEIAHPTAKLHERGGPIEPTYSEAMVEGWTRDGFYAALEDCEYMVRKKRYLRNATLETMKEQGDL
jgi:rubrerythrin